MLDSQMENKWDLNVLYRWPLYLQMKQAFFSGVPHDAFSRFLSSPEWTKTNRCSVGCNLKNHH